MSPSGDVYEKVAGTWTLRSTLATGPPGTNGIGVPTPVVNGSWIKGVGGVAVWAAITAADLPPQAVASYGTTLPASPTDGQLAILVDSTTNPSYQWTFRYNAGSASAYKWEFIGGTDAYVEVLTAEGTVTLSTWLDLATVGPRVIVPRGGDYDAQAGADFAHGSAAGAYANMGIARNATTPTGAVGRAITSPTPAYPVMMLTSARLVGVTASDDLRLRYYAGSAAGTNNWGYRWIRVRPVRVA